MRTARLLPVLLAAVWCVVALAQRIDGADIANDPELFSSGFRMEFAEMNELYADFGFELEVLEGEQPALAAIVTKYGEAEETEDIRVTLGYGPSERQATLTFHYYQDVGFGVEGGDPEPRVLRVKRVED